MIATTAILDRLDAENHAGPPYAVMTFIFWTGNASLASRFINRVTGGELADRSDCWSHIGLGFYLSDGTQEYYEALLGHDVRGPIPLQHLKEWRESDRRNRCRLEMTGLSSAESELKRQIVRSWVGTVGYSSWQLCRLWGFERLGLRIRTRTGTVCSELVARILAPEIDLTDAAHTTPDAVTPNSAWRAWRAIQLRAGMKTALSSVLGERS